MAQITTGLTNGGLTTHYQFSYDDSLAKSGANPSGPEPARTNSVIAACEGDYNLMAGWFGITALDVSPPYAVSISQNGGGATWGTLNGVLSINVNSMAAGAPRNQGILRYLLVSEMVEQFMRAHGAGWYGSGTEGSQGEGLSRFLAAEFLAVNGLGIAPPGFENSNNWLAGSRADFVTTTQPTDNGPDEATGCALLYIYYLHKQLGFGIQGIIGSGANTLAGVHKNLTGLPDAFTPFLQLINSAFPDGQTIPAGGNPDNPFPLRIPNWLALDINQSSAAIVADAGLLYQLHKDGRIWVYTGVPLTGWTELDSNSDTVAIAASGGHLYQLHRTGRIWIYTGVPHTGWTELDNNPNTVAIVADGSRLYQLHRDGRIWIYTGVPHTGWTELDNNSDTVAIAASGGHLYQLHRTGRIWIYTGVPHTGWTELDNNPNTVEIVADNAHLYQRHRDGRIWSYTGTPHTGWLELDNNSDAVKIVAAGEKLFQLHRTGKIWQYVGPAHTGWINLDANGDTSAIAAAKGHLYQIHKTGKIWRYGFEEFTGYPV